VSQTPNRINKVVKEGRYTAVHGRAKNHGYDLKPAKSFFHPFIQQKVIFLRKSLTGLFGYEFEYVD
jgi:hypothetical protein